ncbi:4Fe-4S dicluster domain-containing protein, partial [Allofournierella sp.]
VPLEKEEQALLEQAARLLRQSELVACTGCGYCAEGCPAGIPIPQVLELYNQALPAGAPTAGQAAAYAALPGAKAAQCVGCKKCETVCPQRLPVAARMRQTAALFGQTGA